MSQLDQQRRARRRLTRPIGAGRSFAIRTVAVALFDAFIIPSLFSFAANGSWSVFALLAIAAVLVNWAYLSPRTNASRWLTPGLVMMLIFVLYPVLYTAYVSFTNFQTGNLLDKDQAVARLEDLDIRSDLEETVGIAVYRSGDPGVGELALLVIGGDREPFFGPIRAGVDDRVVVPLVDSLPGTLDITDPPTVIGDFELVPRLGLVREESRLEDAEVNLPDGSFARVKTFSTADIVTVGKRFQYDPDTNTLLDAQYGRTCDGGEGTFYCSDVPREQVQDVALLASDSTIVCDAGICDDVPLYALDQTLAGWREVIGTDNYTDILTNERIRTPFVRVLIWNVVFAALSVLTNFALGLGLALALKDDRLRGRSWYRSIFIIPYAIPGFLSILVWQGLLNTEFGKINGLLDAVGLPGVDWLGGTLSAQVSVLLVNLWLGFPYMFLICSGALTSIPEELIEAARVDGAGVWKVFRMVTLPLLLVSTAPLLIGAFAFNFNNFVLIFLLTGGGPPLVGYDVPVGATDLLISFTFDIAVGAGRGSQYGLASAIIVIIFLVLATTSAMSFRLTKKLEDIYDQ